MKVHKKSGMLNSAFLTDDEKYHLLLFELFLSNSEFEEREFSLLGETLVDSLEFV
jgi:hypothetical protein